MGDCSDSAYLYQAFRLYVSTAGYYSFKSISNMNTFGYLYNNSFVPPDLSQNLLASNNDGVDNQGFRLYIWLDTVTTYVLVVTTFNPNVTGPFSINVTGLASVTFSPMNASGENSIHSRALLS
ncbi:unnamed protein product [Rotaria sp. Silwood1]|nr:unnamed protein product [Rotaria sp. Silwood1]